MWTTSWSCSRFLWIFSSRVQPQQLQIISFTISEIRHRRLSLETMARICGYFRHTYLAAGVVQNTSGIFRPHAPDISDLTFISTSPVSSHSQILLPRIDNSVSGCLPRPLGPSGPRRLSYREAEVKIHEKLPSSPARTQHFNACSKLRWVPIPSP